MIKINSLNKTFNKNKKNSVNALKNISLTLPENGIVAIFGKSGSGKSTLLNMIGGLDTFDSGNIELEGVNYTKIIEDKCRINNIGYIFQNYLLDDNVNVYENVARGLRTIGVTDEEVIFSRVMTALKNVDMVKFFKRKISTLSGGQQQRVAIARAMVKGAKIVLADEPTGNLDEYNTVMIMDILKEMSKNCLVILVTHEQDIIDNYADKIIEIKDGDIIDIRDGQMSGIAQNDKTKVFLGDLPKKEFAQDGVNFELYGDTDNNLSIKLVNVGGKYYLSANVKDVKFINDKSEVTLVESTKEQYFEKLRKDRKNTIENLGYIKPQKSGNIFDFASSYKEGARTIFSKKTKGSRLLFSTIVLFSIVVVVFVAMFSSSYHRYKESNQDSQIGYVTVSLDNVQQRKEIVNLAKDYGFSYDYIYTWGNYCDLRLQPDNFESLQTNIAGSSFSYKFMDLALTKDKKLLSGHIDNLSVKDIVVSDTTAEYLIASIKEKYHLKDLSIDYLIDMPVTVFDKYHCKIKGIVQYEYNMIYLDEALYYSQFLNSLYSVQLDEIFGLSAKDGEAIANNVNSDTAIIEDKVYTLTHYESAYNFKYLVNRNELMAIADRIDENIGLTLMAYVDDSEGFTNLIESKYPSKVVVNNTTQSIYITTQAKHEMLNSAITTCAILAVMFVCVYFLMYTSLAGRIKEIAVYRCIGVAKNNIIFKFFAEAIMILTTAVLPAFIVTGAVFIYLSSLANMVSLTLGFWLISVVATSAILIVISLLPVLNLLRKTPVQLLSKYDI